MASKLQYTYRSSAALSDDVIEYIKEGVEKAGSFPKFVDALVAASMSEDGDLQISSQAMPILPSASAKVDFSNVEKMIDESRKEIMAAILQRVESEPVPPVTEVNAKVDMSGVEERIDESRKDILAAISQQAEVLAEAKASEKDEGEAVVAAPTRDDLVALRRAIATDIVKAKEEEIEKLDEILGAIKGIELEPVIIEKEVVVEKGVPAAAPPVSHEEKEAEDKKDEDDAVDDVVAETKSVSSARAELRNLPFDDEYFSLGIKDLLGLDYIDEIEKMEEAAIEDSEPAFPVVSPSKAPSFDADAKESYADLDIDDETVLGAEVLLGMA